MLIRAAHASHTGDLYLVDLDPPIGIIELVRDTHLESCSALNGITFWFTRSTSRAFRLHHALATELLLASTRFTAREVPIMRGNIAITSRDETGQPAALNPHQIDLLTHYVLRERDKRVLGRRFNRDIATQRRLAVAEHAAHRPSRLPWRGQ